MTRVAALTRPLRRYLTERLGRLNAVLSDLSGRLRTAVAARVAEGVAGVVREAVEDAFGDTAAAFVSPRPAYHDPTRRWADDDRYRPSARAGPSAPYTRPRWGDDEDDRRYPPSGTGLFRDPYEPDPNDYDAEPPDDQGDYEPAPRPAAVRPSLSTSPQVRAALALGLQASAWWLGRRKQASVLSVLAVGASAGTLVLLGGPLLTAGAATLRSLLSLSG